MTPVSPGAVDPSPVVLVHGSMHGAWCWSRVTDILDDMGVAHRAIDLPGHGRRAAEVRTATVAAYASAVIAVLKRLTRPAVLVGHSMAGHVVARASTACPGRVARLVLLNAQVLSDGETHLGTLSPARQRYYARLTEEQGGFAFRLPDAEIHRRWLQDLEPGDPVLRGALAMITPQPFLPLTEPVEGQDFSAAGVGAIYVCSSADVSTSHQRRARFLRALPARTPVYQVPGSHDCMISEPRAVARVLAAVASGVEPPAWATVGQ